MNSVIVLNGLSGHIPRQINNVGKCVIKLSDQEQPDHKQSDNGQARWETDCDVIAFYSNPEQKQSLLKNASGSTLILIKVKKYNPERWLEILADQHRGQYDLYLFPGDFTGNELSVRLSCRLGGSALVSVEKISILPETVVCRKKVYSGYMEADMVLAKKPFCLAVSKAASGEERLAQLPFKEVVEIYDNGSDLPDFVLDYSLQQKISVDSLDKAKFIVIGGNGLGSSDKVKELEKMAKSIHADFGVSRPVAMSAMAPMGQLVGVSGSLTSPDICITAGVSGAPAFFSGIENSRFIVSINVNGSAPIIKKSDVAIVDDYAPVIKELVRLIQQG
jgi:electron transfer flavoprotein alpha subunit